MTFDTHFLFLNIVYFLVKIFFLGKELDELTFEDDGENLKVNAERLHRMASIEGYLDDESESKSGEGGEGGEGGGDLRPRMSVLRMASAETQISSKVTKLVGKRNMMMRE